VQQAAMAIGESAYQNQPAPNGSEPDMEEQDSDEDVIEGEFEAV